MAKNPNNSSGPTMLDINDYDTPEFQASVAVEALVRKERWSFEGGTLVRWFGTAAERPITPAPNVEHAAGESKGLSGIAQRLTLLEKLPHVTAGCLMAHAVTDLATIQELLVASEELLEYLCWRAESSIISGFGGSGKSTLLRVLCGNAATAGKRVLWITNENEPKPILWWQRVGALHPNIQICDLRNAAVAEVPTEERFVAIRGLIDATKPDVVVFDSLYSMMEWAIGVQPDNAKATEWRAFCRNLVEYPTATGAGVVVLHHLNTSGGFAGSHGIVDFFDHAFKFSRGEEDGTDKNGRVRIKTSPNENLRFVRCVKTRGEVESSVWDSGGRESGYRYHRVEKEAAQAMLSVTKTKILEAFVAAPDGLTKADWKAAGIAESTVRHHFGGRGLQIKDGCYTLPAAQEMLDTGVIPPKQAKVKNTLETKISRANKQH